MYLTMFTCQFHHISTLKRTPQSLSSDRQKGTAKIQTKDTSKRIDVFFLPCMISLLKTQDVLSALVCWQFQCYRVFKQQIYECNMHPRKCSIETRIAFVYRFRNMIEILVALYYILISLVFLGLHRVGHTILDPVVRLQRNFNFEIPNIY